MDKKPAVWGGGYCLYIVKDKLFAALVGMALSYSCKLIKGYPQKKSPSEQSSERPTL